MIRRGAVGAAAGLLALVLGPRPVRAVDPAYLEADPNGIDVVFSPAIQERADALGGDPVRIYEFVRNELDYQVYYGLMKGPEGTLQSGGGNDYDLAALLVSMLRHAGTPTRFVRGFIEMKYVPAQEWTGATGTQAPSTFWAKFGEPKAWEGNYFGAQRNATRGVHRHLHIWVEALVPMARYRGRDAPAGDARGLAWIPLDPSWKLHDWPPDDPNQSGSTPTVAFQYGVEASPGPNPYYESVSPSLPADLYEDQFRDYLAGNPGPNGAVQSIEDVAFRGRMRQEAPGILPVALPYTVLFEDLDNPLNPDPKFFAPRQSARLAILHTSEATGGLSPYDEIGKDGEPDYQYLWKIHVCDGGVDPESCTQKADGAPGLLVRHVAASAALDGRRVTLTFPADDPGSLDPEDGVTCTTDTVATIWVDGVVQDTAGSTTTEACDGVQVVVETLAPLAANDPPVRSEHLVEAGGIYAVGLDAQTGGPEKTRAAADALVTALEQDFPMVEQPLPGGGPNAPYVTTDQAFFSVDFPAQEALVGGLLHLVATRYAELRAVGEAKLNALHHHLPLRFPATGLVSSGLEVDYAFTVPFSARPAMPLIDMRGVVVGLMRRTGQVLANATQNPLLTGHHASAAEHTVWGDVASLEAISTVKGFQIRATDNREILKVTNLSEAVAALGSCSASGCNGVDLNTYCRLRDVWGPENWLAANWDAACGSVQRPNPAVVELRLPDKSAFTYLQWTGEVYMARGSDWLGFLGSRNAGFGEPASQEQVPTPQDHVEAPPDPLQGSKAIAFNEDAHGVNDPNSGEAQGIDPVALATGNLVHVEKDLEIPGPGGLNLRFVRTYNSRSDYEGALGHGWIHTWEQHLRIEDDDPGDVEVFWVDERGVEWGFDNPSGDIFVPRPWFHHTLERDATGAFTLTTKAGIRYRFHADANGDKKALLDWIEDRNGNRLVCEYEGPEGQLMKVWTMDGATPLNALVFTYTGSHLSTVSDWTGRAWSYEVNANGDLVSYVDAEQNAGADLPTLYDYDTGQTNPALDHNLRKITLPADRDGQPGGDVSMEVDYYANDTVYRQTNALGETSVLAYDFISRRTTLIHPDGAVETHDFDPYGNLVRHTSGRGVVRRYVYDPVMQDRIRELDGFGLATEATYDATGNLASRTDRLGHTETWSYNAWGQPLEHVDRRGNARRWEYDGQGNLLRELATLDAALRVLREHRYDARGNRTETLVHRVAEGSGVRRTRFYYDPAGTALVRVVDALGHVVRFEPDALGRPRVTETSWAPEGEPPPR